MDLINNITSSINNGIKNLNDDLKNSKFLNSLQDSIKNIVYEAKKDQKDNNEDTTNKVSEDKVLGTNDKVLGTNYKVLGNKDKNDKVAEDKEQKGLSVINTPDDLIIQDPEIQKKYLGCFNDGQGQPLFGYRFPQKVKNIKECIDLGTKSKYKYIALKNGNECWAGNSKYNANGEVEKKLCNIKCESPNTETCGGSIFNQVYKTNYYKPEEIESKILNKMNPVIIDIDFREENINSDSNFPNNNDYISNIEEKIFALTKETFSNTNDMKNENYRLLKNDMKNENYRLLNVEKFSAERGLDSIDKNLDYKDFTCAEPIGINYLFLYIVIVVILITIIFMYLDKK